MKNSFGTNRLDYLDTLRFLAVIVIIINHFDEQCFLAVNGGIYDVFRRNSIISLFTRTDMGKYGLAYMCIISGFLILYKQLIKEEGNLFDYIMQRYVRLMIPCGIVTAVIYIVSLITKKHISIRVALCSCLIPGFDQVNPHLWCIGEFFLGNVLILFIHHYFKNKKWYVFSYVVAVILLVACDRIWAAASLLGALCFQIINYINERDIGKSIRGLLFAFSIIAIFFLNQLHSDEYCYVVYLSEIAAAFLGVFAISLIPLLMKVLSFKKIIVLKRTSYTMFVLHYAFYGFVLSVMDKMIKENAGTSKTFCIGLIIMLIADIILAQPLYFLGEKHLPKMINKYLDDN